MIWEGSREEVEMFFTDPYILLTFLIANQSPCMSNKAWVLKKVDYSLYTHTNKNMIPRIRKVTWKDNCLESSPGLPHFHLFVRFVFIVCVHGGPCKLSK